MVYYSNYKWVWFRLYISSIETSDANPFTFEGVVTNLEALSQTTSINVNVFNSGGTNVFSTSSDSILGPQDTMVFVGQDKFTPSNTDIYNFDVWASSLDTISDTMSGNLRLQINIQ